MTNYLLFNEVKENNLKILSQYVPIVAKVHGPTHPEFYEVRDVFNTLIEKINTQRDDLPNLDEEFKQLQEITNNYQVPSDVCESYEAVYNLLKELNEAYNAI